MPYVHPSRRLGSGGLLTAYNDELPTLYEAGIRAVVSLLNIPSDSLVYESAGFSFMCLPLSDGAAPTVEQAREFERFVSQQRNASRPVAVHCEAGIGRTGTMLATYLVSQGESAENAIRQVRSVEKLAIETREQIRFLEQYAASLEEVKTRISTNL